jgi:transposase-like protein
MFKYNKLPKWFTDKNLRLAFAEYCRPKCRHATVARILDISEDMIYKWWDTLETFFLHFKEKGTFGLDGRASPYSVLKSKRGSICKLTRELRRTLIAFSEIGYSIDKCCQVTYITRRSLYNWFKEFPDFEIEFRDAREKLKLDGVDALKKIAFGFEHKDDYVSHYQGTPVIIPRKKYYKPEAPALELLLRNRDAENWNLDKRYIPDESKNKGLLLDLLNKELDEEDV